MSDEGTTGYCLVPEAGTEEGCGAAQGCWEADGGLEGVGPQCPAPYLGPLPPQEMGLWPLQRAGPRGCQLALCMGADMSLECWA